MNRGSVTPLVASIVAISALVTVATTRVARMHLDLQVARTGADLVAVSVAAGAGAERAAEIARLNGTELVALETGIDTVTARVSRGGFLVQSSATAASVD